MPVTVTDAGSVTWVTLSDRIDAAGAVETSMPMYYAGESRDAVIIDLTKVSFIASLGLRNIVALAKAVYRRNGKVVLLSPQPLVEEVLVTSGINELIPIRNSRSSAEAAVVL